MRLGTHAPALGISALVHLGAIAIALAIGAYVPQLMTPPERALPLNLAMFAPQPPAPAVQPAPPPVTSAPAADAHSPPLAKPAPRPQPKPATPRRDAPPAKPRTPPQTTDFAPAPRAAPRLAEPEHSPPVAARSEPEPSPREPAPTVDPDRARNAEREYKSALRSAIEANKHYPGQARRMRQEGQVEVEFTLRRNGDIRDVRIVSGSGSDILDHAALEAVRSIDGKLPFPEEIARSEWTFTLPLNYALR